MGERKQIDPKPAKNVMLAKGAEPITVDGDVSVGDDKNPISFPDERSQRAGFYHPRAAEILRLYPDRYKPYVS